MLRVSLFLAALCSAAVAQPLPDGVVFDDFSYDSSRWAPDDGLNDQRNRGSLFGWNAWRTSLTSTATVPDRLWYRGYSWSEPSVPSALFDVASPSSLPGTAHGAAVLRAPAGYAGPDGHAQAEIHTGFLAREGAWAARVNFSDLRDVRGLMQSFWAMSMYTPIVRLADGTMEKQRSEIDHEFNNWFHIGWLRGSDGGNSYETQYDSDQGGVFDDAGFYEGGVTHIVPMRGPAGPDGRSADRDHACTVVRNETVTLRLSPATCADLLQGAGPMLVYGIPVLTDDLAVDLLMVNASGLAHFEVRAAWQAPSPDGTSVDRYVLRLVSAPTPPGTSQPMAARLSQYVTGGTHGPIRFGDRPLLRDHDFRVDWFFYSPDATLDLDRISLHVGRIRRASVRRLNTLGRSVHRPATRQGNQQTWDESPTAFINDMPARILPGTSPRFAGSYSHRTGDLRVTWTLRYARAGRSQAEPVVEHRHAWLQTTVPFPHPGEVRVLAGQTTQEVTLELEIQEYHPNAFSEGWNRLTEAKATRSLQYRWDGSAWTCVACAAAADPRG